MHVTYARCTRTTKWVLRLPNEDKTVKVRSKTEKGDTKNLPKHVTSEVRCMLFALQWFSYRQEAAVQTLLIFRPLDKLWISGSVFSRSSHCRLWRLEWVEFGIRILTACQDQARTSFSLGEKDTSSLLHVTKTGWLKPRLKRRPPHGSTGGISGILFFFKWHFRSTPSPAPS